MGKFIQRTSQEIKTIAKKNASRNVYIPFDPIVQYVDRVEVQIVEVIKEIPTEVIKYIDRVEVQVKEIVKQVDVEVIKEVEKIVHIPVETIRDVERKVVSVVHKIPYYCWMALGIETLIIALLIIK